MSRQPARGLAVGLLTRGRSVAGALGLIIGALAAGPVLAEKPPLDFNAFDDWPTAQDADLSTDGRYALYVVSHRGKGVTNTLVIQALRGGWKMETEVSGSARITRDGRTAVFVLPTHTLCLLMLGTSHVERIPHVSAFRLVKRKGGEWLAYQSDGSDKAFIVRDLARRVTRSFARAVNHWFSGDGASLILQTTSRLAGSASGAAPQSLQWIRLFDAASVTFWQGANVSDLTFDATNTQVVWMSSGEGGGEATNSLWYYRAGTNKARVLVDQHSWGIDDNLRVEAISNQGFSQDADRIFINLKEKDLPAPSADAVKMDVWSYKDPKLQSQQLKELASIGPKGGGSRNFVGVVPIHAPHVIRLEQEKETVFFPDGKVSDTVLLLRVGNGNPDERNWTPSATNAYAYFLVSTKDGTRKPLALKGFLSLSPDGKHIFVEDELRRSMSSYTIATGALQDLTRNLPVPLNDQDYDENALPPPRGIQRVAWMDHDAVLIGDHYDLWRLDMTGRTSPFNVTRGFGRRHDMEFQLTNPDALIASKQRLILHVVSHSTEEEGFYSQTVGSWRDPQLLTVGPYHYELTIPVWRAGAAPSAVRGVIHLVRRESAGDAPNYFYTSDFKTFTPLSRIYPERTYNWLTAKLLSWTTPDGRTAHGVLYRPEDFDPTRQYPLILHYYEKLSGDLNRYQPPQPMSDNLPIAWFVSHGYLVFTPDIHYTIGYPGRSALDTVVSAAQYLASFPWVDAKRMGLQGHSWGGFETDYIVTHTNLFAAAMSSSGISDAVSDYDSLMASGVSRQFFYELGQMRIGPTLWERPDLYIENSAVFRADKVTTPLLMMSNKDDNGVPFAQGVEFFVGLRRLGKKVWMLQYDGEGHSLSDEQAKRQHTIRVTQFFDYYLKGASPPIWMTKGIPARLKGIEAGLELDTSGAVP